MEKLREVLVLTKNIKLYGNIDTEMGKIHGGTQFVLDEERKAPCAIGIKISPDTQNCFIQVGSLNPGFLQVVFKNILDLIAQK